MTTLVVCCAEAACDSIYPTDGVLVISPWWTSLVSVVLISDVIGRVYVVDLHGPLRRRFSLSFGVDILLDLEKVRRLRRALA